MTDLTARTTDRRTVLKMAGAGGAALATVTFVSACGSGEKTDDAKGQDITPELQAAVQKAVASGEVPVGKAAFLKEEGVVITQPTAGEYKVFSDVCPHQRGKVTMLDEKSGRIVCVLHGSQFDPATGAVVVGPSAQGLSPLAVNVMAPTPTPSA